MAGASVYIGQSFLPGTNTFPVMDEGGVVSTAISTVEVYDEGVALAPMTIPFNHYDEGTLVHQLG